MGSRILVIEDNAANLELMTYLLNAFGHMTIVARDGAEGMAEALRCAPDLILCDLALPGLDGYEVMRRLKAERDLAGVPMVAVTASAMVGDREKVIGAGFDGYISKPINPEGFVPEVVSYLARSG
jgi:two-component system cell cycle response regulator